MKVKIIKSVIVKGTVVNPGKAEPLILDVDQEIAENLIKIGCAADPTKLEIETETRPAEDVIAAKDAEIADLKNKLDELTGYVRGLEAETEKKKTPQRDKKKEASA
ncbi:MAG: hypothetical protein JXB42_01760 [Deltaproteobacteria bacterium]|nr:hypothetical protein [Deltaproteobacteria bacterium]